MVISTWVEANQGFLSLMALVAALGLAYLEWRLLLHRDRSAFRNDVQAAIDVVERVVQAMDEAGVRPSTAEKGVVGGLAKDCADALKAIAGSRIHTAAFAVAVIDAANHLEHFSKIAALVDGDRPYDRSWKPAVLKRRDAIVACLPTKSRRLPSWMRLSGKRKATVA